MANICSHVRVLWTIKGGSYSLLQIRLDFGQREERQELCSGRLASHGHLVSGVDAWQTAVVVLLLDVLTLEVVLWTAKGAMAVFMRFGIVRHWILAPITLLDGKMLLEMIV